MVGAAVLGSGTPIFSAPVDPLMLLESRRLDGFDNVLLRYSAPGRTDIASATPSRVSNEP